MTAAEQSRGLLVRPLPLAAEVRHGDDLTDLLLAAVDAHGVSLVDGDVVAVASKVVAKAEGAAVPLDTGEDPDEARRRLARDRAVRVVADAPWVLVVETHHGLVCANAGIDVSNVPDAGVALPLPEDPDASAARMRQALLDRTGVDVGIVVTDTFGRPWRLGQTDVAVGAAGVEVLRDDRGRLDRHGRRLGVSMAAVGDALAAAADLVRRKHDGSPFVLLRGLDVQGDTTAAALVRPSEEDLFRVGGPTAPLDALRRAGRALQGSCEGSPGPLTPQPLPPDLLARLHEAVGQVTEGVVMTVDGDVVRLSGPTIELGAARTAAAVVATTTGSTVLAAVDASGLTLRFSHV